MDLEFPDSLTDIARIAGHLLPEALWVLIALTGFALSSLNRLKQRTGGSRPAAPSTPSPSRQARSPTPAAPVPFPVGTPLFAPADEPEPAIPRPRQRSSYGSRDKAVWGSVFDDPREEPKWGFDESEWGSSFGQKRTSEPTISRG